MIKKIFYFVLLCVVFFYGVALGFYKFFPLPQILAWKQSIEYEKGVFEQGNVSESESEVEIKDTFLQKLLIKKVEIPNFSRSGGGIGTAGNILYYVSNKGVLQAFDLEDHAKMNDDVLNVPMNIEGLIESGHPYKNDFHISWFRVSNIYVETADQENHHLFVSHNSYDTSRDCITFNVSRTVLQPDIDTLYQNSNWDTIFTAAPCIDPAPSNINAPIPYEGNLSGGIMANFNKETLLVTVGDFNRNGLYGAEPWAQDPSNPYGKFILIDKNSGDWSVFASGSRNASGLLIDQDSLIWAVENGPRGGDELNLIERGNNYGWPNVSYGLWYDHDIKLSEYEKSGTHPNYRQPIFSWLPAVAPRGLIKIEGSKFEYWKGDLLMGTMRDHSLHRLRLDKQNRVVYDEKIQLGHRIRDLIVLPDDKIALFTDDGYLVIIDDGGGIFENIDLNNKMTELNKFDRFRMISGDSLAKDDTKSAKNIFQEKCTICHTLTPNNQIGPHLDNLSNRVVGSVEGFNYSETLEADNRRWNDQLLKSFLIEPEKEFQGTQMQEVNLTENEVDSLVYFLIKN